MNSNNNLNKLIEFVQEISAQPDNTWFRNELLARLIYKSNNTESEPTGFSDIVENIELIRKYLTLDVIPIIDYSEIENEVIRNQLFRDSIEMAKYRLGKINNTISFDEFCRYAHLQAEELINYFYIQNFNTKIERILDFLKSYGNYNPNRIPENLNHIDYSFKLKAFVSYAGLNSKTKNNLEFLNKIRNELSHRNSLQKEKDDEILRQFEIIGFSPTKFVLMNDYPANEKNIYFQGKYIISKRMQNFEVIYDSLNTLKQSVIVNLKDALIS